jgi:hypothetical protein
MNSGLFARWIGVAGLLVGIHGSIAVSSAPSVKSTPVSVSRARENAKLMHAIYAATLDVMHERFFRNNRAVLPARALEDVFAEIESQSNVKASWLAVNTKAMSINHEAKSEFEKKAAAAIAAGKGEFELVEDGYYRRAAAIPLGSGCVSCHTGFFGGAPKSPRFAALVISVPVSKD